MSNYLIHHETKVCRQEIQANNRKYYVSLWYNGITVHGCIIIMAWQQIKIFLLFYKKIEEGKDVKKNNDVVSQNKNKVHKNLTSQFIYFFIF